MEEIKKNLIQNEDQVQNSNQIQKANKENKNEELDNKVKSRKDFFYGFAII